MKRALFAIASVAIMATAVGVEAANAQYAPAPPAYTAPPAYGPSPSYTRSGRRYPPTPMAGQAMATAQDHPTSCAKLYERARLVTVAPTLSPMPNGKPLSSASGTAESASSAIAFRRTDCSLKPRRNASAGLSLRTPRTTRQARHEGIREELAGQ